MSSWYTCQLTLPDLGEGKVVLLGEGYHGKRFFSVSVTVLLHLAALPLPFSFADLHIPGIHLLMEGMSAV
jgi:hypothetical protein